MPVRPHWDDIEIRREDGKIHAATLRYNVTGYREGPAADAALDAAAHPIILGNLRKTSSSIERLARNAWDGTVEYEAQDTEEGDEETYSFTFDTAGGIQHIKQSYETIRALAPPGMVPPNYRGAIGVQGRDIAGCDVIVPQLTFTMTQTRNGILDMTFIRFLSGLTGRINRFPFLMFSPGDVLFEGGSGSQKFSSTESPAFDLSYKFRVQPTIHDLQVGSINIGYKRGWDYFWLEHIKTFDHDCVSRTLLPRAAYVERVYEHADLNLLLVNPAPLG